MLAVPLDIVGAILLSKDGKMLMGEKRPGKTAPYPGWYLPGGGVEQGESLEQALRREMQEETGLDISGYKVRLVDDQGYGESIKHLNGKDTPVKMRFFMFEILIDDEAANIRLSEDDDMVNLRWFSPDELRTVELAPPSISLFKRLGYL